MKELHMPFKLFMLILLVVIITLFAGFNIQNTCDVSFVFHEFKNVPVFVTVLFSFAAGCIAVLPFTFRKKKKEKKQSLPPKVEVVELKKEKKSWFKKKKKEDTQKKPSSPENEKNNT